jgi:hypothetical protein
VTLGVVGSFTESPWDISRPLALRNAEEPSAPVQLQLPSGPGGKSFDFKLVLLSSSTGGVIQWEAGPNRHIDLPVSTTSLHSKLHIHCIWSKPDKMIITSDTVICKIIVPSVAAAAAAATSTHSLRLVGSTESLGLWRPEHGFKLTRKGDVWIGQTSFPASQVTEAKLVLVDEAGEQEKEWEEGSGNRVIQPHSSSVLILHWGVTASAKKNTPGTRIMPFDFTRVQLRWDPAVVGVEESVKSLVSV